MKKQLKTLGAVALASLTAVALASCKGEQVPTPDPNPDNGTVNPQPNPNPNPNPEPVVTEKANGVYNFIASDYAERTKILGALEKYAVEENLTGITLFEDSSCLMYHDSVKKGSNTYIPGYGFGILTEGEITADLATENNPAWKRYYHTLESEMPGTINMMNDKGSVVNDLSSYLGATYWGNQMNETGDGYEWVNFLSKDKRPTAVNPASNGLATKYRFEVRTDLKYATLSKKYAKYNGQQVKAEDFITPFKLLLTQAHSMERGAETLTGPGSIKGSAKYYADSKSGYNEASWNQNMGVKVVEEGGKTFLEFEFNLPTSRFYAMYYLTSTMNAPVPAEFIKELGNGNLAEGMKNYGNKTADGLTPVDTFLSTGPYVLEQWSDQAIVMKKNSLYNLEGPNRYKIAGIHFKIAKAIKDDPEFNFKEFQAGNCHVTNIPHTKLKEYKSDPRTVQTVGATTTKLNVNATDQATWEQLFGENGTVKQTPKNEYWKVEPAMSNKEFTQALSFALNRKEFADSVGRSPSVSYFGQAYLADPENGIIYNSTEEHKNAIKSLTDGSDGFGYNFEKAKALFKSSTDKLIAEGKYKEGDKIVIDCVWQAKANVTVYGKPIETYWLKAFEASGSKLKLEVNHIIPNEWSDAYYKHMMCGKFDVGFGGISGNPLNPLNFLEVLKSDNSSQFTLNWGTDTSKVSSKIVYNNQCWSFDALWTASELGAYVENGELVKTHNTEVDPKSIKLNADGSVTFVANLNLKQNVKNLDINLSKVMVCGSFKVEGKDKPQYVEDQLEIKVSEDKNSVTVTISKELVAKYTAANLIAGTTGLDFYFDVVNTGIESQEYDSVPFAFPTK